MKYLYNTDKFLYDENTVKRILDNLKKNLEICEKIKNMTKLLTAGSPLTSINTAVEGVEKYTNMQIDKIVKELEIIKKRQDKNLEKSINRR